MPKKSRAHAPETRAHAQFGAWQVGTVPENSEKTERYRTMMVGEAPGEDLGYDPSTIPTEPLEPEEDD